MKLVKSINKPIKLNLLIESPSIMPPLAIQWGDWTFVLNKNIELNQNPSTTFLLYEAKTTLEASQLIHSFMPRLSAVSTLKVLQVLQPILDLKDIEELLSPYIPKWTKTIHKVFEILSELNQSWLEKIEAKELNLNELTCLSWTQSDWLNQDLIQMSHLQISKSQIQNLLQLLCETQSIYKSSVLEKNFQLLPDSKYDLIMEALFKLRYPETSSRDQKLKQTILLHPSSLKLTFERRGDKSGYELKHFISSQSDLIKLQAQLQKLNLFENFSLEANR